MKEYMCDKCEKIFISKTDYTRHTNRKFSCEQKKDIVLASEIDILKKELIAIKEKNIELENELNKIKSSSITNIKTQNNNVDNMNVVQIVINAYGKEDLSHLTEKHIRKILDRGFKSIPQYIEFIHFNDDAPENKNICISNRRDSVVNVFDGNKWQLQDKQQFLNDIKEKGIDFIEQKIEDLDENKTSDKRILTKINRFLQTYRDNENSDDELSKNKKESKEIMKKLDKDIQLILYNNRDTVKINKP